MLKTQNVGAHSSVIVKHKPRAAGTAGGSPDPPQDGLAGAAVFKRDHVADLVADVHVHLVRHPQRELDGGLLVRLGAHDAPVLVADREAVLGTPLRHLRRKGTGELPQEGRSQGSS